VGAIINEAFDKNPTPPESHFGTLPSLLFGRECIQPEVTAVMYPRNNVKESFLTRGKRLLISMYLCEPRLPLPFPHPLYAYLRLLIDSGVFPLGLYFLWMIVANSRLLPVRDLLGALIFCSDLPMARPPTLSSFR